MKDIDKLCKTFSDIGIEYTRMSHPDGVYEYVFLGQVHSDDLDTVLRSERSFYEFENGTLASY